MSAATSLVGVVQQISVSLGIALGAASLEAVAGLRGGHELEAADFWPAFLSVGLVSALSSPILSRLHPTAGDEMAGRAAVAAKPIADSQ